MSIHDKIKERISQEPKSFYVEEWDETIFATPLTCGEMSKLQKRHPNFLTAMEGESMVDLIIMKCLDKEGEKLFTLEHKPHLLRETLSVISAVAGKILNSQLEVDYEKN